MNRVSCDCRSVYYTVKMFGREFARKIVVRKPEKGWKKECMAVVLCVFNARECNVAL